MKTIPYNKNEVKGGMEALDAWLTTVWQKFWRTKTFLYAVYIALLAAVWPHTAWAFGQFQSAEYMWLAWLLAGTFEAAIFVYTHEWAAIIKAANHLEPKEGEAKKWFWFRVWRTKYVNFHAVGLLFATIVSGLANFSYAVEHGADFLVYTTYTPMTPLLFHLAFGGILPLMSLLFATVLAQDDDTSLVAKSKLVVVERQLAEVQGALADEQASRAEAQEALIEAQTALATAQSVQGESAEREATLRAEIASLQATLEGERTARTQESAALDEVRTALAETESALAEAQAMPKLPDEAMAQYTALFDGDSRSRAVAWKKKFPNLPNSAIGTIVGVSKQRVGQLLKEEADEQT